MSKYFAFIHDDKEVYDYKFKKHHNEGWYHFCLGEHILGVVYKKTFGVNSETYPTWGVIVYGDTANHLIPSNVEGFRTRHDAVDYLLKAHELTREFYNNSLRDHLMFNVKGGDDAPK